MSRSAEPLAVGDRAPDFRLPTQRGQLRSLSESLASGPVLLAFHRGTWCPNCRRHFSELADHAHEYRARGVQLIVVVAQRPAKVKRYIEETGLPFNILIDDSHAVLKAYGVWHRIGPTAWNIGRPALFAIDRHGVIRYVFVGTRQDEFPTHPQIQEEIDKLIGEPGAGNRGPGEPGVQPDI